MKNILAIIVSTCLISLNTNAAKLKSEMKSMIGEWKVNFLYQSPKGQYTSAIGSSKIDSLSQNKIDFSFQEFTFTLLYNLDSNSYYGQLKSSSNDQPEMKLSYDTDSSSFRSTIQTDLDHKIYYIVMTITQNEKNGYFWNYGIYDTNFEPITFTSFDFYPQK